MNICLIHPSRGREKKAFDTAKKWLNSHSNNHNITHIMIIDQDDPEKEIYIENGKISESNPVEKTIVLVSDILEPNCVYATNQGARYAVNELNADILIFIADDFDSPLKNWDQLIIEKSKISKDSKWIIKVFDGVQDPNGVVITMPIMSRALYDYLGYLWHPEYKSMWVDVDLYFTCLPFIIHAHDLLFQHNHPTWSGAKHKMDETYLRSNANWNQGAEVFNRRRDEYNWPTNKAQYI